MKRTINRLKWAKALSERPSCIPLGRPRGVKGLGLRYERSLARALPAALPGQWFEFEDSAGRGFCQTDLLLPYNGKIGVLEVKLSYTREAEDELRGLYVPVVRKALGREVFGLVVCKNLRPGAPGVRGELVQALEEAAGGLLVTWHWLGNHQPMSRALSLHELVGASPTAS